ncbi:MAG: hypothetical protein IT158_06385 [Bryobacterales bacterium]|nr:hypothetical protein [Bryobacterales bacterium]
MARAGEAGSKPAFRLTACPAASGLRGGPAAHAFLGILLAAQGCLVLARPGLLPLWGDEHATLAALEGPAGEMLRALRGDVHPPLYYLLLRVLAALPFPFHPLELARLFSGVCVLATTVVLDRLWLRTLGPGRRRLVLALWCFSPAAVLYGRMGRSYALQALLAVTAVALLGRFGREPCRRRLWPAALAALALLYTHYVPGIALAGAFSLHALIRGKAELRRAWVPWAAVVAAGYAPWLFAAADALGQWAAAASLAGRYTATGHPLAEQALKLGYGLFAFLFGETVPPWLLPLTALPAALLLPWSGAGLPAWLAGAAAIGYLGVARWVSFPFVPARLLWLLPFFFVWLAARPIRLRGWRAAALACLLLVNAASLVSYFGRRHFFNPGYMAPLDEIAATVRAGGGVALVDIYNTDAPAFAYYLGGSVPHRILTPEAAPAAEAWVLSLRPARVWVLRNTHDTSPGGLTTDVERAVCRNAEVRRRFYVPYEAWQREAARRLGATPPPTHYYQLTECRLEAPAPPPAASPPPR